MRHSLAAALDRLADWLAGRLCDLADWVRK